MGATRASPGSRRRDDVLGNAPLNTHDWRRFNRGCSTLPLQSAACPTTPETFESKLPHVGTTIFTVMSRLAAEHDAINLSQGFPDFDCAQELRDLVTKYINSGLNQYPPMAGVMACAKRVAEKVETLYGSATTPSTR